MHELHLERYARELVKVGIAPRHVRRTMIELAEHADDLLEEARAAGASDEQAQQRALSELGDPTTIAAVARSQPQLLSWAYRFPQLALVVYPLIWIAVSPVVAGVQYAPRIARWGACLLLSGLVTAAMILILQLSITLT